MNDEAIKIRIARIKLTNDTKYPKIMQPIKLPTQLIHSFHELRSLVNGPNREKIFFSKTYATKPIVQPWPSMIKLTAQKQYIK